MQRTTVQGNIEWQSCCNKTIANVDSKIRKGSHAATTTRPGAKATGNTKGARVELVCQA